MDAASVKRGCERYFHVEKPKSVGQGFALGGKVVTYITIITPLILGVALGISSLRLWYLQRNISVMPDERKSSNSINRIADSIVGSNASSKSASNETMNETVELKPEELALKLQEATDHNSQMSDTFDKLFEVMLLNPHLTFQDFRNLAQTSKILSEKVKEMNKEKSKNSVSFIKEIIHCSGKFNSEIERITEGREKLCGKNKSNGQFHVNFKFDVESWGKVITDLESGKYYPDQLDKIQNECQLDLVEALAEYNIASTLDEPSVLGEDAQVVHDHFRKPIDRENRPIQKIILDNLMDDLTESEIERARQVLLLAKETLIGDLSWGGGIALHPSIKQIILGPMNEKVEPDALGLVNGFYCSFDFDNFECHNWDSHYYPRRLAAGGPHRGAIHFDWLIGKRHGDRIVVPHGRSDSGDNQAILRLNLSRSHQLSRLGPPFEWHLVSGVKRLSEQYVAEEEKQALIEKLEKAYGKEYVDSIVLDQSYGEWRRHYRIVKPHKP